METAIVACLIALAAIWLIWTAYRRHRGGGGCGCSCAECPTRSPSCPSEDEDD
ncbi:MAG: FeoB-associated Cys-rich membrane protein [Planctomycetota bacterium]